jgi:hypothetical protein
MTHTETQLPQALPEPGVLFDDILRGGDNPSDNACEVNAFFFSCASILAHDLFAVGNDDPIIETDLLSVLYGRTHDEADSVRLKIDGLLIPDTFADPRIDFQLPSTTLIVVLLNRHHNAIAKQLLLRNENYYFTHVAGPSSSLLSAKVTDDRIFTTARAINIAFWAKILNNQLIPMMNCLSGTTKLFPVVESVNSVADEILVLLTAWGVDSPRLSLDPLLNPRNSEEKLRDILRRSTTSAGLPLYGQKTLPMSLRAFAVDAMEHTRDVNLCTLNEFRRLLGIPEWKSFADMHPKNPHIQSGLSQHYQSIDHVELYVGTLAETASPGSKMMPSIAQVMNVCTMLFMSQYQTRRKKTRLVELTDWGSKYVREAQGIQSLIQATLWSSFDCVNPFSVMVPTATDLTLSDSFL